MTRLNLTRAEKAVAAADKHWPSFERIPLLQAGTSPELLAELRLELTLAEVGIAGLDPTRFLGNGDGSNMFGDAEILVRGIWRGCKHVYRFDAELASELADQGIDDRVPTSVLEHVPYPLVFLEFPFLLKTGNKLVCDEGSGRARIVPSEIIPAEGFFFCRNEVADLGEQLIFVPVCNGEMDNPLMLDAGIGTIGGIIEDIAAHDEKWWGEIVRAKGCAFEEDSLADWHGRGMSNLRDTIVSMLNPLLYVCADNADIQTVYVPSGKSRKPKVSSATVHAAGVRIGRSLGEARKSHSGAAKAPSASDGSRTVAPHIRRAHWHSFWTGPRDGERTLSVKWVAPTIVKGGGEELPAIHDHKGGVR